MVSRFNCTKLKSFFRVAEKHDSQREKMYYITYSKPGETLAPDYPMARWVFPDECGR